jgi:hypothetical protein
MTADIGESFVLFELRVDFVFVAEEYQFGGAVNFFGILNQ